MEPKLINRGPPSSPNPEWNGYHCGSLVAMARYRGYEEVAKLLEQARARRGRLAPAAAGAEHPIHTAAKAGDIKRIRELLDENPAAIHEAPRNGRRPLSAAVEFGHADIVRLLLERGADPNWPELGSPTGGSLQRAAGAGNREWVELLAELAGADAAPFAERRSAGGGESREVRGLAAGCGRIDFGEG
jgi:ankyrin repeat protein